MRTSQARTVRRPPNGASTGTGSTARAPAPAPLVLDRYRLHSRLGAGAFGTVWMASDERLDRAVAVKILPRERIVGGRFEREARAAARLAHPGIVTLYEAAVDDEGAYLVSELVRGPTLDELLEAGRLSDRDIVAIGVVLCDALAHAHSNGVVHRDVKPSNVLVPEQPASPSELAKLTDFGVARVVGGDSLTRTGDVIGTLAYMSPEQAEGRETGVAADLYSLALVLYEALTGVNPLRFTTVGPRARRLGVHLPPLRRQRRDLPRELGTGIDLALRPRARERGSILHLRRALVIAHAQVSDAPGVVGTPWTPTLRSDAELPTALNESDTPETPGGAETPQAPINPNWPTRGVAALVAAAVAAWVSGHLLTPAPIPPAAAALLAATVTLLLPRIGWLALSAVMCAVAIAQEHPGAALLLLPSTVVPALLLARHPTSWPLPAGAPALGLLGLAGAWPALAARAGTPWRRAALGFTGWLGLVLIAPLAGRTLYLPLLPGTPSPGAFEASPYTTFHHVLAPIISSGALAPGVVWAVGALVLPWLVLGRSIALDFVRVAIWAAILSSATAVAATAVNGAGLLHPAPSAAIGAVASAVVALAPSALVGWHRGVHRAGSAAEVS